MANLDLNQAIASNNASLEEYTIASMNPDVATDQEETVWWNDKAAEYWGIFNKVGDLQSAFKMKGIWDIGKGWEADTKTTTMLNMVDGWGKETFDDILFNLDVMSHVFGDSYAEIVTHNGKYLQEGGVLINLIPLNPADVGHAVNRQGRIKKYLVRGANGVERRADPREILHFCNKRFGKQHHGISDIESMRDTILADDQSFADTKNIVTFQAKPFIIYKMKTDDDAKIQTFVTKVRNARKAGDDLFIPDDENLLSWEVVQVNPSSIILEWRTEIRNRFYRQIGMPLIIFGASGSTESGGKIEYTGHEQVWEYDQRRIENILRKQLGITINLRSPASLLQDMQNDQAKDGPQGLEFQPSDTQAGAGR